jgi:hypothetical protein
MTRMIAITIAALLGGCVSRPLSVQAQDGGTTPETGIYKLSIGPATGNCTPPTVSGPFEARQVYVGTSTPGTVTLDMPAESTIEGNIAFSTRDLVDGRFDTKLEPCFATDELRIVLDETSANELTATRTDVWSKVASATRGLCVEVPAADCSTSAQLHYALVEPCAVPCKVEIPPVQPYVPGQPPSLVCICPDGGM